VARPELHTGEYSTQLQDCLFTADAYLTLENKRYITGGEAGFNDLRISGYRCDSAIGHLYISKNLSIRINP
jgi:hypothetical protein